jgi:hypothetical protein
MPQISVMSPTLYYIYIYIYIYILYTWCLCRSLYCDTCIYVTDCKEGYVTRRLQRGFSVIETGCERWNIKINKDKTQVIYFSHDLRSPETHLPSNGRNIPLVSHIKYLGIIFNKRITWRLHIKMTEAKAFKTFIRIYFLFKSYRCNRP